MGNKKPTRYRRGRTGSGRYKKDVIKKKRVCLKCDREFISINDDRLCNNCHYSNRNMGPAAEGYCGGILVDSGQYVSKSKKVKGDG